jgi:hypothetical protein
VTPESSWVSMCSAQVLLNLNYLVCNPDGQSHYQHTVYIPTAVVCFAFKINTLAYNAQISDFFFFQFMSFNLPKYVLFYFRFEVLMVVKMSVLVFWIKTLCRLACRFHHFRGTYCLHLHNFSHEDGGSICLWNTDICLQVHMVLQLRRPILSCMFWSYLFEVN